MKKPLLFSVPAKTFLLGEYGVLWGGSALLINTWPRFFLTLSFTSPTSSTSLASSAFSSSFFLEGIPENSPTRQLLKKEKFLPPAKGFFHHPHQGRGGWGASSAEFALFSAAMVSLKSMSSLDLSSLLEDYQKLFQKKGQGPAPSGADFLSQLKGGIVFCHPKEKKLENLSWPFPEADLALLATGHSLPTHEHLSSLSSPPPPEKLSHLQKQIPLARKAMEEVNLKAFVKSLHTYGQLLKECGWVLGATQDSLQELIRMPGVLAAKGCGSMGAEVILVLFLKEKASLLIPELHKKSLQVMTYTEDLCQQGLLPALDLHWS